LGHASIGLKKSRKNHTLEKFNLALFTDLHPSKLCSANGCDYKNDNLKLSERKWSCPKCDTQHDRDINAAKNIEKIGREASELTPVKRTASVFSIKKIQADSLKQESLAS